MTILSKILSLLGCDVDKPGATPDEAEPVDIAAILDARAVNHAQKLDWRHSVVDLLKCLDMPSGMQARETLASEMGFDPSVAGSAQGNDRMRRELMRRVSENGGKVPAELL